MSDLEQFRTETRAWLEANCPEEMRQPLKSQADHCWGGRKWQFQSEAQKVWMERMADKGWTAPQWPKEYGGGGLSPEEAEVLAEEMKRINARTPVSNFGFWMLGPALLKFGSEELKRQHLPPICRGEIRWCQGYSEPNAGSDLSNIQTRARLDGDAWVLDGQKVWTSWAHNADWMFVLARTTPGSRGAKGLSFLLVPMRQPGVIIRPIRQMTGDEEFNEIFLDGARTDAANIVGAPGDGWAVAMATLTFERGVSTLGLQTRYRRELDQLIAAAKANGRARDPLLRHRLARAEIGLSVMRANCLRMLANIDRGTPGREGAVNKLYYGSWHQRFGELVMDVLGRAAEIAPGPDYAYQGLPKIFLQSRADTIYAGTNEIQRNIIAERWLGLPREPRG